MHHFAVSLGDIFFFFLVWFPGSSSVSVQKEYYQKEYYK